MSERKTIAELRLIRLTPEDVAGESDGYRQFRDLVLANEPAYPGIRKWLEGKVAAGIRSGERVSLLGLANDLPVATAVVKRGRASKFCHLRLDETIRDRNLGELFFALMAAEVRQSAAEVHFTLPESLWAEQESFFRAFGFTTAIRSARQYRLFEEELRCTASFENVWRSVIEKLPKLAHRFAIHGHAMFSPLLLSVTPRYAERIFSGAKSVEIRRRFSTKWAGTTGVVYATSPEKRILGEVSIANVVPGSPEMIWNTFSPNLACTREEFDSYVEGTHEVYALVFDEVVPYAQPIPLSQLEFLLQDQLLPPQSYCTTANNAKWSAALAIAALLHGGTAAMARARRSESAHQAPSTLQMPLL